MMEKMVRSATTVAPPLILFNKAVPLAREIPAVGTYGPSGRGGAPKVPAKSPSTLL